MLSTRRTECSGGGDDDDDDDDRCEYATLTCRVPAAAGGGETKVHLKATFRDDRTAADDGQATVMWVRALVVGAYASGVYEGRVSGHQAAAVKSVTTTDDSVDGHATAVRRWLGNARHALVGRRNDDDDVDDDDAKFLHCLERTPCGDGGRPALVLTWKKKLRPLGAFALGSVCLCGGGVIDGTVADPVCGLFVEPLIRRLSAERRRGKLAGRAAAGDARLLMADNERLLDALRSAAEGRRLDDRRLMARFAEVLNAKKKKLDAVRRELSDLKEQLQQRDDNVPSSATVDATELDVVVARRRGKRASRGRTRRSAAAVKTNAGEQLWPDRGRMAAAKRGRRRMPTVERWLSEEDDVDAEEDQQQKRQESVMETDDRVTNNVVDANGQQLKRQENVMETDRRVSTAGVVEAEAVDVCDRRESVMETDYRAVNSAVEAEAVVNLNIFEADTLIDDCQASSPSWFQQSLTNPQADTKASPASSPPWLQQLTPTPFNVTNEEPSPLPRQPSPINDVGHRRSQKKSILDDLWSGIL